MPSASMMISLPLDVHRFLSLCVNVEIAGKQSSGALSFDRRAQTHIGGLPALLPYEVSHASPLSAGAAFSCYHHRNFRRRRHPDFVWAHLALTANRPEITKS
jgi:hypothetical protein